MTVLYVVRHGETTWNREGRVQGHTDVPLNEAGRQQARDLGERLTGVRFHAAYASDLARARETAEIIVGDAFPVVSLLELRERDCGRWEGQLFAEIAERDPTGWQAWLNPDPLVAPHGGENETQLNTRIGGALQRIVDRHPDHTVLVVSHGGAIRVALNAWLNLPARLGPITNCAAFVVEVVGSEKRLIGKV
jgi:probable phosphoglycerate mutase